MAIESPPWATQAGSFGAEQTRRAVFAALARTGTNTPGIIAGGLGSAADCQVLAPGSGMSVNVSTGEMIIGGNEGANQGGYGPCRITSTTNIAIAAANATNPRIDLICGTVNDAAYTAPAGGVTSGQWAPIAVTGSPTSGATLANLSGAPAIPGSSLALAWVLVPASATNIITADILNVASVVSTLVPPFTYINGSGATSAASGQWIEATAGVTVTLPAPSKNSIVAVSAGTGASGSSQVTVAAGASGAINGVGLSSAASFKLGTPGASVVLEADGSNWWIVAGQQDTGWVGLTSTLTATGSYYTPSARLIGARVELSGAYGSGSGLSANGTVASVPSGFAPTSNVDLSVVWETNAGTATAGILRIVGASTAIATVAAISGTGIINLDGLSYRLI